MEGNEERIAKLESELEHLKVEFAITLGRANGLHLTLVTLARDWCKPAAEVIFHLAEAIEAVEATGLHTPLRDEILNEQLRVSKEMLQVLAHAAKDQQGQ